MNQEPFNANDGAQWTAPQVHWNGSNYSSGGGKPPKREKPPKQKKEKSSANHNLRTTIIACACSCLVASAASVGGFAALVGTGVIPLGGSTTAQADSSESTSSKNQITATNNVNTHSTEEEPLQASAAKALKSVVLIQAYTKSGGTSYGAYYGFNFSFGDNTEGNTEQLSSEGSGVIATADGYIITNHHVVDGASSLKVTLPSGDTYDAKLIGSDSATDLALLKINASNLDAAEFGSSGELQVGDRVMAVGNPGGSEFQSSVTFGYVSALNRTVTTQSEYQITCIQTDAAINPGNSGGALVNTQGQVVGINSSKIVSTSYEGLGFAIPIDTALPIINDLRENGYVKNRAALGISGQYVDSMTAQYYGFAKGYYVSKVNNESAKKAGLTRGDIITKVDGKELTSANALTSQLLEKSIGDTVTLTVDRDGKELTMEVTLQAYSES
ncbi:MAG: trypsin-like peptidase domain-containing protein [Oscillospiraceae bacterium]|nr:trypsin-like peptidase domain-containing protein [Oscillospiraceae bacterium]